VNSLDSDKEQRDGAWSKLFLRGRKNPKRFHQRAIDRKKRMLSKKEKGGAYEAHKSCL
jgi:hypothetical protein